MRSHWLVLVPVLVACQPRPSAELTLAPESTPAPATVPSEPPTLRELALNEAGGCVIRGERTVLCWDQGFDRPRELLRVAEPIWLDGLDAKLVDLHLDEYRVCALDERGRVLCSNVMHPDKATEVFALGKPGKLIVHSSYRPDDSEVCVLSEGTLACNHAVAPRLDDVRDAAFDRHGTGCAVRGDATRVCWSAGQPLPDELPGEPLPGAVELDAHTLLCLRTDAGALWCSNTMLDPLHVELHEVTLGQPSVDIELATRHLCALTAEGAVLCRGDNSFAQLGSGDSDTTPRTITVPLPGPARELATAGRQSCAIVDNDIWCWGASMPDLERTDSHAFPLAATRLFVDDDETCATLGRQLHCWSGSDLDVDVASGGIVNMSKPVPVMTAIAAEDIEAIDFDTVLADGRVVYGGVYQHLDERELDIEWSVPGVSSFAADADLVCMARGSAGRLACVDGWGVDLRAPNTTGVTDIELRSEELCVAASGEVRCLDYVSGDTHDVSFGEWTRLSGVDDAVEITDAYSRFEPCARRASGGVTCWSDPERTPFAIAVDDAVQTAAFDDTLCVLDRRGALRCGPGVPEDTSLHTLIESGVVEIAGGFDHVCARIDDDGDGASERIACHGSNATGQLGKLPETLMLAPTQIRLAP